MYMNKGKLLKINDNKTNNETKYPTQAYKTRVIINKEKESNNENQINQKDKQNMQIKTYGKSKKYDEKADKNGKIIKKVYNNCSTVEIKVTNRDYVKKNSIYQNIRKITARSKYTDKNIDSSHKKSEEKRDSKNKMICLLHNKNYTCYCKKCSKYICIECVKLHFTHKKQIIELSSISCSGTEKLVIEKNIKFNDEIEFLINDIKKKIAENNKKINASLKSGIIEEDKYIDNFLSIDENDLYERGLFLLSLLYKDKNNKSNENNQNSKNNTTYDKYKIIKDSFTLMGKYFKKKLKIEKSNSIEIPKKNKLLKLDNFKLIQEIKCDNCITSITVLKNLNLLVTFKGGHAKIYEKDNYNHQINYKEIISIDEDEY